MKYYNLEIIIYDIQGFWSWKISKEINLIAILWSEGVSQIQRFWNVDAEMQSLIYVLFFIDSCSDKIIMSCVLCIIWICRTKQQNCGDVCNVRFLDWGLQKTS